MARSRALKKIAFFLTLLLCISIGPLFHHLLFKSNLLLLEDIEIDGNVHIDKASILALLEKNIGKPLYGIDFKELMALIEKHPWVKKAYLSRVPPNILKISLIERTPILKLKMAKKSYLVDELGEVFYPATKQIDNLPEVKLTRKTIGIEALSKILQQAIKAVNGYSNIDKPLGELESISLDARTNVTLLTKSKKKITLGSTLYDKKWRQISKVLPYINNEKKQFETIYFSGANPKKMSVKF